MSTSSENYGKSLPDQFDRIASLSDLQHDLADDVRELYKERVALEESYADRLEKLADKAKAVQAKRLAPLAVGSDATKGWDDQVISKCTLGQAVAAVFQAFAEESAIAKGFAESLRTQMVAKLKDIHKTGVDLKTQHAALFTKLVGDRDKIYADRIKMKQKYDEECKAIEDYRKKHADIGSNDKHAGRAAKHLEQQHILTQNAKNTYLISIEVSNKLKHVFYEKTLPDLENALQDMQAIFTRNFVSTLQLAQEIQLHHLERIQARVNATAATLAAHDPEADQALFIGHNLRPFSLPNDAVFEPCASHYDTAEVVLEPSPKIQLQNKLGRARSKASELKPSLEAKRAEVDKLTKLVPIYQKDAGLGKLEDVILELFSGRRQLATLEFAHVGCYAEEEMLSGILGSDEGSQQPHTFKSSSFSIPTECVVCNTNIWGLSKQGKTCRKCHVSVHNKCELLIPADCGNPSRSVKAPPPGSSSTLSVAPTMSTISTMAEPEYRLVQALYAYEATSGFELNTNQGEYLRVLEEDDGSGWVKVLDSSNQEGLVPASYVVTADEEAGADAGTGLPSGGGDVAGEYVRGLYDYSGQSTGELDVVVGGLIQLTLGGREYAEGWYEGVDSNGKQGIFPSSYVESA